MESNNLRILVTLFFYIYVFRVNSIENSDTFVKIQKCVVSTANFGSNLAYFSVRSKLECLSLCKSSDTITCNTFEIYGSKNYTCVLRSDCGTSVCPTSSGTTIVKLIYQTVNCGTTSIFPDSTLQSIQTTAAPCGVAGDMVGGVCQCETGCTGTYCDSCYKDCSEGYSILTGVRAAFIKPTGISDPVKVLCNFDQKVTYIQYRKHGNVDFNRSWSEYENGFGDISGDFWLGNKYIWALTQQKSYNLGLRQYESSWSISSYQSVTVDSASNFYTLTYGSLSSGSEGLSPADTSKEAYGQRFSTYDRDPTGCAKIHGAGWWYNVGCSLSNLNGNLPVTFGSSTNIMQTGIGIF